MGRAYKGQSELQKNTMFQSELLTVTDNRSLKLFCTSCRVKHRVNVLTALTELGAVQRTVNTRLKI